jgi:hypothetical protein
LERVAQSNQTVATPLLLVFLVLLVAVAAVARTTRMLALSRPVTPEVLVVAADFLVVLVDAQGAAASKELGTTALVV